MTLTLCARLLVLAALLAPGGCISWQEGYDHAARGECERVINVDDRRACFAAVQANSQANRQDQRD